MEVGAAIMLACSAGIAQLVERNLAKVEVGSSRLLSRSRFPGGKRMSLRFPLLVSKSARSNRGGVAKWLCSGLQSRLRRFDSDPRLQSFPFRAFPCPDGEIGRRKGLKIPRKHTFHAGSIPAPGTNSNSYINHDQLQPTLTKVFFLHFCHNLSQNYAEKLA